MSAPRAWVLNLDAETELANAGPYTASEATRARVRQAAKRIEGLLAPDDVVVDDPWQQQAGQFVGDAWCPTPGALRRLEAAGLSVPEAPAIDVLRRVNDRRFAIELDPGPLATRYVTQLDELSAMLSADRELVLKRALSFAGRGHRRVRGALGDDDRRWCSGALRAGLGLAVEPWVERVADFVQHGWVRRDGGVELGEPLRQVCDARGEWQRTMPPPSASGGEGIDASDRRQLRSAAEAAGRALAHAGYFGPFGVDAFHYRARGGTRLNPIVEVNARYGMGWGLSRCPRIA